MSSVEWNLHRISFNVWQSCVKHSPNKADIEFPENMQTTQMWIRYIPKIVRHEITHEFPFKCPP